jgi:AraC family transcriptional regulator
MTQAAFELQQTDAKVIDIAMEYGYTSPTAFNRAFQSVHGISPIAAKSQGTLLHAYPAIQFSVQVTGGEAMPYRIEEKNTMRIVGVRVPITEDMAKNHRIVPLFWNEFIQEQRRFQHVCELSNTSPAGVLGVTAYQSPGEMYYYIAAATDRPVPKGLFEYEIPASTWVLFESEGRFKESVQNIFRRFLTEWLPFSGYSYAELPDIEVYPVENDTPQSGHSEVWIAIKKED